VSRKQSGRSATPAGTASGPAPGGPAPGTARDGAVLLRRHLRFGWILLCIALPAGLVLEALHGFKVDLYLGVEHETRRLMWTLAHAHGTLFALVHLAFGLVAGRLDLADGLAPRFLQAGAILLPAGFLLGGVVTYGGDPGPGIALAPVGGVLMVLAVLMLARPIWNAAGRSG